MRDERRCVQLAVFDQTEDLGGIAAVHAAGLEDQVFAVHIGQGKHLRLVVQCNNGDNGVRTGALPCKTEAFVRACHLADHIRAAVRAVQLHELLRVVGRDGEHIGIALAHKAQTGGIRIAQDNAVRVMQHGTQHGADTGRACAEDEHGITALDLGDLRRPVAGGEYIAGKQRLPIGDRIGDAGQTLICVGDPDVFGLTAVDTTAERPAAVGIGAVVDKAVFAEKAVSAEGFDIHRNAVAGLDGLHAWADLLDYADHLVADRDTGHGARHRTVLDVQIAGADTGHGNADNGIICFAENGFRFVLKGKFALLHIGISEHDLQLRSIKMYCTLL